MKSLYLFLLSLMLLTSAMGQEEHARPGESDVASTAVTDDLIIFQVGPMFGGNWTSFSPMEGRTLTGTGLTSGISILVHSTQDSGWFFEFDAGYQTTSVGDELLSNLRRSSYFGKASVGLTDGRHLAAGLTGAFFKSDMQANSSPFLGLFTLVKLPLDQADRFWLMMRGDFGAMLVDQFTGADTKPLAGSIGLGVSYRIGQ